MRAPRGSVYAWVRSPPAAFLLCYRAWRKLASCLLLNIRRAGRVHGHDGADPQEDALHAGAGRVPSICVDAPYTICAAGCTVVVSPLYLFFSKLGLKRSAHVNMVFITE